MYWQWCMCVVGIEDCGYGEHCWYWECVLTLGSVGFESIEVLLVLEGVRTDVCIETESACTQWC